MEFEEYMSSLTEQIHDKRAKHLVAEEIRNHIEEQAKDYEAEGLSPAEALKEAVRQMGNPIETGMELNKIHKPRIPWAMLALAIFIMTASIVMQAVIFAEGGNSNSSWAGLPSTIIYNCLGFAVILVLLYMDYNFIAKYAYQFYGVFMAGLPVVLFVVKLFSEVGRVTAGTAYYGVQLLFPILFAGIIYKNRNRGIRGIGICLMFGFAELLWYRMVYEVIGTTGRYSCYPALVESILSIGLILLFAVWKGIFGKDKKKQVVLLLVIAGVLSAICMLLLWGSGGMRHYVLARVAAFFRGAEDSYLSTLIQKSVSDAPWLGGQTFLLGEPNGETYGLFVLNSIFTYFGKLAGVIVIAAYLLFLCMALHMSFKQNNRIGFLIGTTCTLSILVRFTAYLALNLGFGLWWTTLVPFLSYGRVSAVMNGIYIGLILCVYRNSGILKEEYVPQKRLPRIRVTVE